MVVDPLVAGAEVVLALQTVVARHVDPALPAVLSCIGFRTDALGAGVDVYVRLVRSVLAD